MHLFVWSKAYRKTFAQFLQQHRLALPTVIEAVMRYHFLNHELGLALRANGAHRWSDISNRSQLAPLPVDKLAEWEEQNERGKDSNQTPKVGQPQVCNSDPEIKQNNCKEPTHADGRRIGITDETCGTAWTDEFVTIELEITNCGQLEFMSALRTFHGCYAALGGLLESWARCPYKISKTHLLS